MATGNRLAALRSPQTFGDDELSPQPSGVVQGLTARHDPDHGAEPSRGVCQTGEDGLRERSIPCLTERLSAAGCHEEGASDSIQGVALRGLKQCGAQPRGNKKPAGDRR